MLSGVVLHDEAGAQFLDSPGRREAARHSMQPLMHDQPEPTCDRPENNSAEHHGADHRGAKD